MNPNDKTDDDLDQTVAVSPADQTSDRKQSDADQVATDVGFADAAKTKAANRAQADADQAITVKLLHKMIASSADVITVIQESMRVRRWMIVVASLFGTVMLLSLATLIYIALQNRDNSQQIRDCIPPPPGETAGACYEASQRRIGDVAAQLAAQNAAALTAYRSCLRANPNLTDAQLQACVVGRLVPPPAVIPPKQDPAASPSPRANAQAPAAPRPQPDPTIRPQPEPVPPTQSPGPPPAPPPPPATPAPDPLLCIPLINLCITPRG